MDGVYDVFARCDCTEEFTRSEVEKLIALSTDDKMPQKERDKIERMIYMKYKTSGYIPGDLIQDLALEIGEDINRLFGDVEF